MPNESLLPEDKLEVMNLAWEMIKDYPSGTSTTPEGHLEKRTKLFDQAYKAIIKTVFEENQNS